MEIIHQDGITKITFDSGESYATTSMKGEQRFSDLAFYKASDWNKWMQKGIARRLNEQEMLAHLQSYEWED